jgi:molecular chaperone HtpG
MNTNRTETDGVKTGARLLETLTSALYADPIVVFREYVQNAIDSFIASSQQWDFRIDINLFFNERKIVIRDNGGGIPDSSFVGTMMCLGKSSKKGDQMGFRGIGRLAGLSFCDKLQFRNRYNQNGSLQTFSLDGKIYRKILSEVDGGSLSLDEVMNRIKSISTQNDNDSGEWWSFEVSLFDVSSELLDCIYAERKYARSIGQSEANSESFSENTKPTDNFVNAVSMLLPVPYAKGFIRRDEIAKKYKDWIGGDICKREFKIFINGEQLFKPFNIDTAMDFCIIPMRIKNLCKPCDDQSQGSEIIGLLWMSFDYVFKAMKKNFGIAVRSKNMLVRGGSVLAEEAANSRDAITTYGQYLSAIKGVTGELLLETDLLSDNARRDWFKVDANSLQLREQLCHLMNRMHNYRYKISRYMHNDRRTDIEKQQVIEAYRELVADKSNDVVMAIERYIESIVQQENAAEKDDKADIRDILGYTMTQKRFYRELMLLIYNYFERYGSKEITEYYSLKSYVLKFLNRESIDSEATNLPKEAIDVGRS